VNLVEIRLTAWRAGAISAVARKYINQREKGNKIGKPRSGCQSVGTYGL
jgi:hypothetical protein